MKPLQEQCRDEIAKRMAPGETPHVTIRTEWLEDGGAQRIAEAFSWRNHSPNANDDATKAKRKNLVSVAVPFMQGETRGVNDDFVSNEGVATEEAFARLLSILQAPPPPAALPGAAAALQEAAEEEKAREEAMVDALEPKAPDPDVTQEPSYDALVAEACGALAAASSEAEIEEALKALPSDGDVLGPELEAKLREAFNAACERVKATVSTEPPPGEPKPE